MSYKNLFTHSNGREADIHIRNWLILPENMKTFDQIRMYDDSAARTIADCKATISALIEYRQALAARYNALATMPSKDNLVLERDKSYSTGKVTYYIRQLTAFEDGTCVEKTLEVFRGKDRRAALARFEELKKARPGIDAKMDIERKAWER